jgi:hypothetical protein
LNGSLEPQIGQITSAGFPSWSLYNNTRKYLLGAVSTSLTFGYLSYKGDVSELVDNLKSCREAFPRKEKVGPAIGRISTGDTGRNQHIIVNFNYRVGRLGSDLSLTRDQEISNTFKIKKIEDSGYVF